MATAHSTVAPMNIKTSVKASRPLRTSHSSKRTEEDDSLNKFLADWDDSLPSFSKDNSSNKEWKSVVAAWNSNAFEFDPFIAGKALKPSNDISNDTALETSNDISLDTVRAILLSDELSIASTALGEIFALASVHRSCVRPAVADLCGICTSLATEHAIESVTTSVIASMICTLNAKITSIAAHVEAAESEKLLDLVTRWNTELEKFQWDGDTEQFRAPLDVNKFRMWICENFPAVDERGFDVDLLMLIRPGNKNYKVERHATVQDRGPDDSSSSPSTTANEDICIDKNMEQTMMREDVELAVTHVTEADTLDFLWDDPEEEDSIYDDESDDSDTERGIGIFDSATEISGADVTESDWSEIN
ncbi:hypothetical protein INT43_004819 [Umbelopsis isabellina]|uniref:Uncharacterized protein n=1 Tax=Mortierella isabellina TaxID=91625 RepID=A0A8H7PE71_MORIS|nr:hypothetical protein INT43_004819 [Umbelopsis isabellina]